MAVTDIGTGQTKKWTTPAAGSLSLTADGGMLYYTMNVQPGASVVRAMPTSAPPGPAAGRSRTVVQLSGPADQVGFAAISPGGGTLYFTTFTEGSFGPGPGQLRALNLATGRSRLVYAPAGQAGLVTADPAVRNFLLQIQQRGPTPLRLARLDLATGRVTDLPSGWLVPPGAVLTW